RSSWAVAVGPAPVPSGRLTGASTTPSTRLFRVTAPTPASWARPAKCKIEKATKMGNLRISSFEIACQTDLKVAHERKETCTFMVFIGDCNAKLWERVRQNRKTR